MPKNYVFIVTYGRSGSTLLQSILNSIDGYRIQGENFNCLLHLYRSCKMLRNARNRNGPKVVDLPWLGANEIRVNRYISEVVRAFVVHVLQPREEDRVIGFKEVRYGDMGDEELRGLLEFIEKSFNNCKIIFNKRNADGVAASSRKQGWFKGQPSDYVFAMVKRMDEFFDKAVQEEPGTRYIVNYDEYIMDNEKLRGLFEFLGEPFDLERLRSLLSVRLIH